MDAKGLRVDSTIGHRLLGLAGEAYCQGFKPVMPYW